MTQPWEKDYESPQQPAAQEPAAWEKDYGPPPVMSRSYVQAPLQTAAGVNVGLAKGLGAPVDIVNQALGFFGLETERPVGGQRWIREELMKPAGLGYQDIRDVPEPYRPFARGGETFGESVPFAAAPMAAARLGAQGGRYMAPIVQGARTAPAQFAAAEAAGAGGAALGRGYAEAYAPGDELIGTAAEVAGGIASPIALLNRASQAGMSGVERVRLLLSESGRKSAAGTFVRRTMAEAGEDVSRETMRLRAGTTIPGTRLTAGQKTGSPTLMAIERQLTRKMGGLDNRTKAMMRETTQALDQAYRAAIEAGDPQTIRVAAEERSRWFNQLLTAKVQDAEQRVRRAVEVLGPRRGRAELSRTVRATVEDALGDARDVERRLWGQIPRDTPLEGTGTLDAYNRARGELLQEETLPAPIEAFVQRLQSGEMTSGELLRFRSRMLRLQRGERGSASPDWALHRHLGMLADGALDDLATVPGTDEARAFSRNLNDLFSRGEVGRQLGMDVRGGQRVEPELTLERSIGQGREAGAVAGGQLEAAAQNVPGYDITQRTTGAEQADFLRHMAQRTVRDGKVGTVALDEFRRQNVELLQQFPEIERATRTAGEAQRFFDTAQDVAKRARAAVDNRAAFARVAGAEDPGRAVSAVLSGAQPGKQYRELARLARRTGPEATAGLRAATFDGLIEQATDANGFISGKKLKALLNQRTDRGGTLLETMTSTNVLNARQRRNLLKVADAAERIEDALVTGQRVDDVLADANALEDLLTRIAGANIGGASAFGQFSGAPIVAAGAGSRFARRVMQQIPAGRTREILAEAIEKPALMADLLERGRSPSTQRRLERQINAWLLQTAVPQEETQQ